MRQYIFYEVTQEEVRCDFFIFSLIWSYIWTIWAKMNFGLLSI